MKKILPTLIVSALLTSCNSTQIQIDETPAKPNVKNIIMIIADGMGPAYTSAYRYYADDPKTEEIETTIFDKYLVGSSTTYPASVSGYVTDSAASATALASGIKTYNGAIGVDTNKNKLETVLHRAKKLGKKTGVVVTSQVNHATPASYISHNEYRRNYNELADSYIDNGINTDVLLGGGWKYFIRKDRNLVNEYKAQSVHYIDSYQELNNLPKNKAILGLFADEGLVEAIDDVDKYRLSTMTKAAIPQLENSKGFFMLIEASQIDWAGHGNDINSAMAEMTDLEKTLEYLEVFVEKNPDTLVVLTADHSTGGLTVAANGIYEWKPQLIRDLQQSSNSIAKYFNKHELSPSALSEKLAGIEVSKIEADNIASIKTIAKKKLSTYLSLSQEQKKGQYKPNVIKEINIAIKKLIDKKTNTGWTSGGHTAIDVPVFAFGTEKHRFSGAIDNTDIAKTIFKLLEEK
ncbi:MAG: alkaline phosphatase [Colwelliaceae bacterium]|jgi:alkaline phosphatase|nr:alkaline phosphatase [Colwelliaceae bacterium]